MSKLTVAGLAILMGFSASIAWAQPPKPGWVRKDFTDSFSGEKILSACVSSTNKLRLSPPFSDTTVSLCIRQSRSAGVNVMLVLDAPGQFQCFVPQCDIETRFDDGAPVKFDGSPPQDMSSGTIFLDGEADFCRRLKASSSLKVLIPLFQDGSQTAVFDVSNVQAVINP